MLRAQVTVHGRLFAPDDASPAGLTVVVRSGWYSAVATVGDGGDFRAEIPDPLGGRVEVLVDPGPSPAARYFRTTLRLDAQRAASELRIVLVPRRWRIARGTHAGQTVDVRLPQAVARTGSSPAFWRLSHRSTRSGWAVAWPRRLFPIPVAFDTADRRWRASTADSAAFWEIARELERSLGDSLFRPARAAELHGETDGILVKVDRGIGGSGLTLISWTERGRAYDAAVYVRTPALLHDHRVVAHELVHALGFGHTGAWPSIMGPSGNGISRPTAGDIAHMQLLLRVQELQELHDAPFGVAEAIEPPALVSLQRRSRHHSPPWNSSSSDTPSPRTRRSTPPPVATTVSAR